MKKAFKVMLIFVLLVFFGIAISILTQPKGEWVCEEGEWIKLGNPLNPPPDYGCKKQKKEPKEETRAEATPEGIPLDSFPLLGTNDWLLPANLQESISSAMPQP